MLLRGNPHADQLLRSVGVTECKNRRGVLTAEAAWCDDMADVAPADPLCSCVSNCGDALQADAALLSAGEPIPHALDPGRSQPDLRRQHLDPAPARRQDSGTSP